MTKQIPLTQDKFAIVSDHRFEYLNQWKWCAVQRGKKWYATRGVGPKILRKIIYMHREIMGVTDPKIEVDHRDGSGLNNVDDNLRLATHAQNGSNRGKPKSNTSGFIGVCFDKRRQRHYGSIHANNMKKFLGYFENPIEAAKAYDIAAKELHGEFANLNFPQVTS